MTRLQGRGFHQDPGSSLAPVNGYHTARIQETGQRDNVYEMSSVSLSELPPPVDLVLNGHAPAYGARRTEDYAPG